MENCSIAISNDLKKSRLMDNREEAQKPVLALIAHDQKKDDLVVFVGRHISHFSKCRIFTTGTTGSRIIAEHKALDLMPLKSGPLGGDQQIGGMIAEGNVDGLIFFVDPLTPMPHDVDVKALMRLAIVYDIPMALNRSTAEILLTNFAEQADGELDA
jgi:methylglyoxal synthase